MKRKMVSVLVLALLNLWIPYASAENSQDLDPMVSPEAQATVTSESSTSGVDASQAGDVVSPASTTTSGEKVEETKKEKAKSSAKKSDEKKKKKSDEKKKKKTDETKKKKTSSRSSKGAKKHKTSSN